MADDIVAAAARWARKHWVTPFEFRAAITGSETQDQVFARTRWSGRSRRVVVREKATTSRSRKLQEPIHPSKFNPWQELNPDLQQKTAQLTQCSTCNGDKKVTCPICGGNPVVRCDVCDGIGRVRSEKTGKVINCRSCRGTGQRKCQCRTGQVKCDTCAGKGKVDRWLEVAEESFQRVGYSEVNELAKALDNPTEAGDFDTPPNKYGAEMTLH